MKAPETSLWSWRAPRRLFEALFLGEPGAFWLDSALRHETWGRFAIMGARPVATLISRGQDSVIRRTEGAVEALASADPFECLEAFLPGWRAEPVMGLPFSGGLIGFMGYGMGAFSEPASGLPTEGDPEGPPEQVWMMVDTGLVCDRERGVVWAFSWGMDTSARPDPERARAKLRALEARLEGGPDVRHRVAPWPEISPRPALDADAHRAAVERILESIHAGDVYQINLTYGLELDAIGAPYDLFCALREVSPTWFSAFLDLGELHVVSASPERFLRVRDGRVSVRPMKGTRPRGETEAEDDALFEALCESEKDRAENLMIVDLMRNDLGKVCEVGSVEVRELFTVESYATVFQMTSTVEGRLRDEHGVVDAIRACFPPGSMTGAPKVAAMQQIQDLEVAPRGVYSGCLGYIGFDGQSDLSVTIRTAVIHDGRARWQIGGGIVADSEPDAERAEAEDKAAALLAALAWLSRVEEEGLE